MNPNATAMKWETVPGSWETLTWTQYYRNCTQMAKALMSAGVEQHDAINIVGFNAHQWHTANLGGVLCGAISAGQYTTNNSGQCLYIADHCKAKVVFLQNLKQLSKWTDIT